MNWAELNPDLLRLIAKKLYDFVDFIRLRAVCRHWRSAVHPSDLHPQLPYFMWLNQREYFSREHPIDIHLFSLYSNKTYTLPCFLAPEHITALTLPSIGYRLTLPSIGYRLLGHRWAEEHFDPITGVQVPSPFEWSYSSRRVFSHPSGEVILSECWNQRPRTISMWRYSGQNWTKIFEFLHGFKDGNEMISYFNGKLYIVDMRTRKTEVIDVATGEVESRIAHPSVMFQYLINACGDLLGVQLCEPDDIEYKFEIYRLEATESPRWAKLNGGIGNRVLFLDNIIETGFCLNTSEFDGFRGNCIYLRQDHPTRHKGYRVFIARYDLEEHKSEVLPLPHSTGTWFVPTLC